MERTILYLIYSPGLRAFKVGIANMSNERYATHRRKGWMLMYYWILPTRKVAKLIESKVLKTLKSKMPEQYLKKEDVPQNGYTECFDSKLISSRVVKKIIERQIEETIRDLSA